MSEQVVADGNGTRVQSRKEVAMKSGGTPYACWLLPSAGQTTAAAGAYSGYIVDRRFTYAQVITNITFGGKKNGERTGVQMSSVEGGYPVSVQGSGLPLPTDPYFDAAMRWFSHECKADAAESTHERLNCSTVRRINTVPKDRSSTTSVQLVPGLPKLVFSNLVTPQVTSVAVTNPTIGSTMTVTGNRFWLGPTAVISVTAARAEYPKKNLHIQFVSGVHTSSAYTFVAPRANMTSTQLIPLPGAFANITDFKIRCSTGTFTVSGVMITVNGLKLDLPSLSGGLTTSYKSAGAFQTPFVFDNTSPRDAATGLIQFDISKVDVLFGKDANGAEIR